MVFLYFIPVVLLLAFAWGRFAKRPTHAGGIVYRKEDGRTLFLIVSSSSVRNKWVLPKGHIEKNETAEFTAIREVLEEAGVFARPLKKAGFVRYKKKGKRFTAIYFVMQFVHTCGPGFENRQVAWLEKEDALEKLGDKRIERVLKGLII